MRLDEQTRNALLTCLNGMDEYLVSTMQAELAQGNLPRQGTAVLGVIANPSTYPHLYQRMLTEFAQEPFYKQIISDGLWPFHLWLLSCAKLMQPLPSREHMSPWLMITAWEKKLDKVLKLDLPADWEYVAMFNLSKRDIPKSAIPIIKTYEKKFTAFMGGTLQQGSKSGNQDYINAVLRLFGAIIWHDEQATRNRESEYTYPKRAGLLLSLLNAVPNDPRVIESLFANVSYNTPYQLTVKEFDSVVAGCSPEVLAARGASPALTTYLQEFILTLTPKKLLYPNTVPLLKQFQQSTASATPSDGVTILVNSWLAIHQLLTSSVFNTELLLQHIKPALDYLVPQLQQRVQDIGQTFIDEMAPHLATLVENEFQLGIVLYIFESARVTPSWSLLNTLAASVGTAWTEDKQLSQLIPYLLYGIREHALAKLPKENLDAYLQTLFGRVSENALNDVEKAVSAKVWPDLIRTEWKGWRDRRKTSWRDNLPLVGKKPNAQQPKPPTGPQQPQGQATNPNHTFGTSQPEQKALPSPNPASLIATPVAPQQQTPNVAEVAARQIAQHQQMSNPGRRIEPEWVMQPQARNPVPPSPGMQQAGDPRAMQPAGQQIKLPSLPQKGLQINVTIGERIHIILVNNYEQVRLTWLQVLQYWPLVLSDKLNKARSRGITSELHTIVLLREELKSLPESTTSELLVEYLVLDMLIQSEVARICQTENQSFLQSVNYVEGRLEEFKNHVGPNYYFDLRKNITEQTIKDTLQTLIRRYHLMQYMDSRKWDWNKWLEKERKSAKYRYHNVQAKA